MAWTKSIIAFGKLGERTLIDAVPLDEVTDVHVMQEASLHATVSHSAATPVEKTSSVSDMSCHGLDNSPGSPNQSPLRQPSLWISRFSLRGSENSKSLSAPQFNDALAPLVRGLAAAGSVMIMTDDNGYNSGRKYYFQTNNDADRRAIVDILAARSKAARASKEAKGKMQRVRERVGDLIKSDPFQYCFAFLIAMVRSPSIV